MGSSTPGRWIAVALDGLYEWVSTYQADCVEDW